MADLFLRTVALWSWGMCEDLSALWPAAESADRAGFKLMYRSRCDETGEGRALL